MLKPSLFSNFRSMVAISILFFGLCFSSAFAISTCAPGLRKFNGSCRLKKCTSASQCGVGQVCSSGSCTCPVGRVFCNGQCLPGNCCPGGPSISVRVDFSSASNVNKQLKFSDGMIVGSGNTIPLYESGAFLTDNLLITDSFSPYLSARRHEGFIELYFYGKKKIKKNSSITGVITINGSHITQVLDGLVNNFEERLKIEQQSDIIRQIASNKILFNLRNTPTGPGDGFRIFYSKSCDGGAPCVNNSCLECDEDSEVICDGLTCTPGNCCSDSDCADINGGICESNICIACDLGSILCDRTCFDGNCCSDSDCVDINGGTCVSNTCIKCDPGSILCMDTCVVGDCCSNADCVDEGKVCTGNVCVYPDSDGDGLTDDKEDINKDGDFTNDDTDGDGKPNYLDDDDDNDGILTIDEGYVADDDNDSIPNYLEPNNVDTDRDGRFNNNDDDDDGDGLLTKNEDELNSNLLSPLFGVSVLELDSDGDGKPNYLDDDDDNDTILTKDEDLDNNNDPRNDNSDGDLIPNYLDPDDDNDTLLNVDEDVNGDGDLSNDDTDGDGKPNYLDPDDDGDGIPTANEDANSDGDLNNDDKDKDTIPDYLESDDLDTDGDGKVNDSDDDDDGDGILTKDEDANNNGNLFDDDDDNDGIPNFLDLDDDNDGVPNADEDLNGDGDLSNDDTDGDGIPNHLDDDDDGDNITTKDEDLDSDGDPSNDDTDKDTVPDYLEPNDYDTDQDGKFNNNDPDDDGDGLLTIDEDPNNNGNLFDDDTDNDGGVDFLDNAGATCSFGFIQCSGQCIKGQCCTDLDCFIGNSCTDRVCVVNSSSNSASIVGTPKLPKLISPFVGIDSSIGNIGYAYPGSNPSFEIQFSDLPGGVLNIRRVDLVGFDGRVVRSLTFDSLADINNSNIYVISLDIPGFISHGEAKIYITTMEGKVYDGTVEIVRPYKLVKAISYKTKQSTKLGSEMKIFKIKINKKDNELKALVFGKNFAHNFLVYKDHDGSTQRVKEDIRPNPNTEVTIYPSSLGAEEVFKSIRKAHRRIKLRYNLDNDVVSTRKAKMVIVTPENMRTINITLKQGNQKTVIKY